MSRASSLVSNDSKSSVKSVNGIDEINERKKSMGKSKKSLAPYDEEEDLDIDDPENELTKAAKSKKSIKRSSFGDGNAEESSVSTNDSSSTVQSVNDIEEINERKTSMDETSNTSMDNTNNKPKQNSKTALKGKSKKSLAYYDEEGYLDIDPEMIQAAKSKKSIKRTSFDLDDYTPISAGSLQNGPNTPRMSMYPNPSQSFSVNQQSDVMMSEIRSVIRDEMRAERERQSSCPAPCPPQSCSTVCQPCCPQVNTPCMSKSTPQCQRNTSPLIFPLQSQAQNQRGGCDQQIGNSQTQMSTYSQPRTQMSTYSQPQTQMSTCSQPQTQMSTCSQAQCYLQKNCGCVVPVQCDSMTMPKLADFDVTLPASKPPEKTFSRFVPEGMGTSVMAIPRKSMRDDLQRMSMYPSNESLNSPMSPEAFNEEAMRRATLDASRSVAQRRATRAVTQGSTTEIPQRGAKSKKSIVPSAKSSAKLKR